MIMPQIDTSLAQLPLVFIFDIYMFSKAPHLVFSDVNCWGGCPDTQVLLLPRQCHDLVILQAAANNNIQIQ
jgi:hypothetical protein